MEGSISFWGYKEQESNLILPEYYDDDGHERVNPTFYRFEAKDVAYFHQALVTKPLIFIFTTHCSENTQI
jgi:hypothetical protein